MAPRDYDFKTSVLLEEAYASGPNALVQIKGPYTEWIIDLTNFIQSNIYTGKEVTNFVGRYDLFSYGECLAYSILLVFDSNQVSSLLFFIKLCEDPP